MIPILNISIHPRRLFLLDGLGAILTAVLLAAVLAPLENFFGMPPRVLYPLSGIASAFAVYSLSCFLFPPKTPSPFLRIIAIANLSYCLLTATLVFIHLGPLTPWGILYFAGEIVVILLLVRMEWSAANREP